MARRKKSGTSLKLATYLDLAESVRLKDALLNEIGGGASLRIDGASVESISTPCIQVLLSAGATLAAQDKTLTLADPSDVLCEAFRDLGLQTQLDRWRT